MPRGSVNNRRRWLAPEVVQTSAMDCGPAALKCVLDGHGIPVSYARLRDACQTDVDGSSIDTIEAVAKQLGLAAEQVVIPADHLLIAEAAAFPAILVVELAERLTHFVVAWRHHGRFVQVMDPSGGRRWMRSEQLLRELYLHRMVVPASAWREWAGSPEFQNTLAVRLRALGVSRTVARRLIDGAASEPTWTALATLDAITRMIRSLVDTGGVRRGREARAVLEKLHQQIGDEPARWTLIPERYWSVRPAEPGEDGVAQLSMTGAVLVRFRGTRVAPAVESSEVSPLSDEVALTLQEQPVRPVRELFRMLRADRALSMSLLFGATAVAASAVVIEALLFRSVLDIGRDLGVREQRLAALAAVTTFTLVLSAIEFPISSWLLAAGRRLEARLRLRFFEQVPRLGDRYFHSRLTSDIAERVHSLQVMRLLPPMAGRFVRLVCELLATTAGIIWIDPESTRLAIVLAMVTLVIPLSSHPILSELELRMRTHAGALSRYYLDALIGLMPIRTHGAERPLRREYGRVMREWLQSGAQLLRATVAIETLQTTLGFGIAAWLLWSHLSRGGDATSLLVLYWALRVPMLGDELALLVRQYPATRNVMLRLLEPLLAPASSAPAPESVLAPKPSAGGVTIAMNGVDVTAAGHPVLSNVNLTIPSGAHVAIVGRSGAGKSTLVGLLLGWHTAGRGQVLIDGLLLDNATLAWLRRATAWVDPAVHLWNRPLLENLQYGNPADAQHAAGFAVAAANLQELVEKLPQGLQTTLGEGGALVSGGEGQRVRLARALLRPSVRLVILDEPFRGLDRDTRRTLMALVRAHWRDATLLCISHDVAETQEFDRVLVIDGGEIVEDGHPRELADTDSRYRALMDAEQDVRERRWSSDVARNLRIDDGRLVEAPRGVSA